MGLDFFICDADNYSEWEAGYSAIVYNKKDNMHTMWISFTTPYTDSWYLVYSNKDGSSTVSFDLGVDINDDNSPYYSSSTYDETGYAKVLEPDEYFALHGYFQKGTVLSGHFSTFFSNDGLNFLSVTRPTTTRGNLEAMQPSSIAKTVITLQLLTLSQFLLQGTGT
ncbi:MAG: hypothetical protein K9W43_11630 [Candidatus Thorarchaeota archaeon]|nr:hypothetical protein [Candidatus Thorarchaeota archaeon]